MLTRLYRFRILHEFSEGVFSALDEGDDSNVTLYRVAPQPDSPEADVAAIAALAQRLNCEVCSSGKDQFLVAATPAQRTALDLELTRRGLLTSPQLPVHDQAELVSQPSEPEHVEASPNIPVIPTVSPNDRQSSTQVPQGRNRSFIWVALAALTVALLGAGFFIIYPHLQAWFGKKTPSPVSQINPIYKPAPDAGSACINMDAEALTQCKCPENAPSCNERQRVANDLVHRNWAKEPYDSPYFQDCMNYQPCLQRKEKSAELSSVKDWNKVSKTSPLLRDCMAYKPCERRSVEVSSTVTACGDLEENANYTNCDNSPCPQQCREWKQKQLTLSPSRN